MLSNILFPVLLLAFTACNVNPTPTPDPGPIPEPDKLPLLVLTDQDGFGSTKGEHNRVVMINPETLEEVWSWQPEDSGLSSFKSILGQPDECKPVYGRTCILITSSGGGVALIRIADKKALFYSFPGKISEGWNPHSAEVLPDGNIAVACSSGNHILFYKFSKTTPYVANPSATLSVKDAHNVVWDYEGNCLWYAEGNAVCNCTYSCNGGVISVKEKERFINNSMPSTALPHDLAPELGTNRFYISYHPTQVYTFDIKSKTFAKLSSSEYATERIKSFSFGPDGVPAIVQSAVSEANWTSSKTLYLDGRVFLDYDNYLIYKSRWFVENTFSYGKDGQKLDM